MHFSEIDCLEHGDPYQPKMVADEVPTDEPDGTELHLRHLKLENLIAKKDFMRSMALGLEFYLIALKFSLMVNYLIKRKFLWFYISLKKLKGMF